MNTKEAYEVLVKNTLRDNDPTFVWGYDDVTIDFHRRRMPFCALEDLTCFFKFTDMVMFSMSEDKWHICIGNINVKLDR